MLYVTGLELTTLTNLLFIVIPQGYLPCAILCMSKKWEKCTFFVHHIHSFIALKKCTFLEFFLFRPLFAFAFSSLLPYY